MASLFTASATCFITGAGSGLGQAATYALARYGARKFALCDIRPSSLDATAEELRQRHSDVEILQLECDTSSETSVANAVSEIVKKYSRLDIAVNNAGIAGRGQPTDQMDFESWRRTLSVNMDGVWLCQRAEIRQMLQQDFFAPAPRGNRGVIVNVASMFGLVAAAPMTNAVDYSTSKHAVMGLTKTDAIMYAPQGIRINAICPGYVETPLTKVAKEQGLLESEIVKVPQGRFGEMDEIGDAIAFLASPMSSFMCGAGLDISGGYAC